MVKSYKQPSAEGSSKILLSSNSDEIDARDQVILEETGTRARSQVASRSPYDCSARSRNQARIAVDTGVELDGENPAI